MARGHLEARTLFLMADRQREFCATPAFTSSIVGITVVQVYELVQNLQQREDMLLVVFLSGPSGLGETRPRANGSCLILLRRCLNPGNDIPTDDCIAVFLMGWKRIICLH